MLGVAQEHSFNVLFSTGLGEKGEVVAQWVSLALLPFCRFANKD